MHILRTLRGRTAAALRSFTGTDRYGTLKPPDWPLWWLVTALVLAEQGARKLLAWPAVDSSRNGDPAGEVGR